MTWNCFLVNLITMYKYQPHVEKRHEQIKSLYSVAPVMLKNVDLIESLLFVYFLALLIESLMEREVRNGMKKVGTESIWIYPEFISWEYPITDWVMGDFFLLQMNWIESNRKMVKNSFQSSSRGRKISWNWRVFQWTSIRKTGMLFQGDEKF